MIHYIRLKILEIRFSNLIRKLEEKENSVGLKVNLLNDKLERLIEEN